MLDEFKNQNSNLDDADKLRRGIQIAKICVNELGIDIWFNGTTLNLCMFKNNKIYCANIGDSWSILKNKLFSEPIPLSWDHKPDQEDEKWWILDWGGRIFSQNGGPLWVWGDMSIPGLSMTRSIGDVAS